MLQAEVNRESFAEETHTVVTGGELDWSVDGVGDRLTLSAAVCAAELK